ncbi:hypothetical protein P154DRAFT_487627 [Amniculicola lignicola CBS 123094]|uniref:WW domain-containing protein n=1 Tax=Amniculicola lignicola CBS 123094 TaxID=1392246 RepID=A0A6A5WM19_9PLEO|nr:hypothetical protein P154DRAFT_487627 [Amniculicola lignicola CBS 123094]
MNGYAPAASVWRAVKTPDNRTYYHNPTTNETRWDKPEELMTGTERALVGTGWTEYEKEGRPYWYNKTTKETTWVVPEAVTEAKAKAEAARAPPPQHAALPPRPQTSAPTSWGAPPTSYDSYSQRDSYHDRRDRDRDDRYSASDRGPPAFSTTAEVLFPNPDDAEAAFMKLLKKIGAQTDWKWNEVVRAAVKEPHWRAIADPKEREALFRKYCDELRAQEKEKERERQTKVRADFMAMLRSHPEIRHYTRWKTALPFLQPETVFKSAKDDSERRRIFEDYIVTLKRAFAEKQKNKRLSALDSLTSVLDGLDLKAFTRWQNAEELLSNDARFNNEDQFRTLSKIDVLDKFEQHIRGLQQVFNERSQAEKAAKKRLERKNRDAFKELLADLKRAGRINITSQFKGIYPHIHDDPRYKAMLGQDGPSLLELFWYAKQEEEIKFRSLRRYALEMTSIHQFEVTLKTKFEDFEEIARKHDSLRDIDDATMQEIFRYVLDKVKRREKDDFDKLVSRHRDDIDLLRSHIKRLEPAISINDPWEVVKPRLETTKEFKKLKQAHSGLPKVAFEKHIQRLKDKERDAAEYKSRQEEKRLLGRGDREYENGHADSHRRHRTRTRSPELDAYEEERRKAQKDREARYNRDGTTGLSPPRRRDRDMRDRDDRDMRDRRDRGGRDRDDRRDRERADRERGPRARDADRVDHYDPERRRSYVRGDPLSRADPREHPVGELDYGDSRGTPLRRRRESGDSGVDRNVKRSRNSYSDRASRTPAVRTPEPPKEDPGLRSGSEEGEIEED